MTCDLLWPAVALSCDDLLVVLAGYSISHASEFMLNICAGCGADRVIEGLCSCDWTSIDSSLRGHFIDTAIEWSAIFVDREC